MIQTHNFYLHLWKSPVHWVESTLFEFRPLPEVVIRGMRASCAAGEELPVLLLITMETRCPPVHSAAKLGCAFNKV